MAFRSSLIAAWFALAATAAAATGAEEKEGAVLPFLIESPPLYASLAPVPPSSQKHTVIEGENDWKISKRYGVSVSALHDANPGVNWRGLQIGQKLSVPGGGAATTVTKKISSTGGKHTVVQGDNDVVIAKTYGMKLSALHASNPDVNWRRLQIGQKISVASSVAVASVRPKVTNVARITSEKVRTNREGVRIRREPSTESGTRTTVDKGTLATVLDRSGDWYELRFPKGTVGWVRGDMLAPAKATGSSKTEPAQIVALADRQVDSGKASQLISTAKTLLGVRYKWGGTSRGGVDCSGFTTYVFAKSGIHLPRTSIEQSKIGLRVDKADLQAGDLLFFKTGRSSRRINHVGMYVGGGNFIHASSHRHQVVVTSLSEYSSAYAGARRLQVLQEKVVEIVKGVVIEELTLPPLEPAKASNQTPSRVVIGADKPLL